MNKPYQVSSFFDPMIAKLITHGKTREEARFHMIDALQNYGIHGIKNNISYLYAIVQNKILLTIQFQPGFALSIPILC